MAGEGHEALVADLTRRGLLARGGVLGLAALVAYAGPVARAVTGPAPALAEPGVTDGTLQAFADTMVPGRKAVKTDLGNEIHSLAIAGVHPQPGAVEADALALYHHAQIGFDSLAPPFLADLEVKALAQGGDFLSLPFDARVKACIAGLAFDNPTRIVWEAAAAVPFTAFCAAAMIPNATAAKASGYRVMGLPGVAPKGYKSFSYKRQLSRERTKKGYLP